MSFFKDLLNGFKGIVTGDPLSALGSATSLAMGIGATKRQKKLMDYQDQINDANYERERQDKLSDYYMALEDQKSMIADERQYNSIGSQMQRARDANISPLAALGVSAGNTLQAVSPPSPTSSNAPSQGTDTSAQHLGNALTMITSIKELKQRDRQLQIEKERADADNALKREQERKTEVERLLLEIEKSFKDEQEKARLKGMLADNDIKGVEKALKEQEHQQKEEMFPLEKRESESRTKLNNAHANKTSFEDWYQRTHHRAMSNGMAHLIDTISDSLWSGQPGADARIDGRDATTRIGEIFDKLKSVAGYFSDESLFEYAKLLYGWFKDKGISFGPTKR